MSEPARIISGVIQGSCIGPLLFLLFVNRLINIFDDDVTCHLFADDVKLYTVITSPSDWASLQNGLDKVFDWSVVHQLPIAYVYGNVVVLYYAVLILQTQFTILVSNLSIV